MIRTIHNNVQLELVTQAAPKDTITGVLTKESDSKFVMTEEESAASWLYNDRKWLPTGLGQRKGFRVTRHKLTGDCRILITLDKSRLAAMSAREQAELGMEFEDILMTITKN